MRIEMCGPPTSGKSTLARELKKRGIPRGTILPADQTPKKWQSFVNFINEVYGKTEYKSLPTKTLSSLASAYIADHIKEPRVFDELVILCGISMAIRLPKECSEKYFSEAPLPSVLVYLTADTKTLMLRNEIRGNKDRKEKIPQWKEKTLKAIDACNKYIPILKKRGCNILTFNTDITPTRLIADNVMENINAK